MCSTFEIELCTLYRTCFVLPRSIQLGDVVSTLCTVPGLGGPSVQKLYS